MTRQTSSAVITRANRAARDVCLIGCAMFLLGSTPPSLTEIGLGGAAGYVWVLSLLGGATSSLIGLLTRIPRLEIYGCMFAGFAMAVWAVGAVLQDNPSAVSHALACFFLAGTFGQVYRALYIAESGGEVE